MIRRITGIGLTAALLAGMGSVALAQDDKPKAPAPADQSAELFRKLDVNKDQQLSQEEYTVGLQGDMLEKAKAEFGTLDINKNGGLTYIEYKAKFEKKEGAESKP